MSDNLIGAAFKNMTVKDVGDSAAPTAPPLNDEEIPVVQALPIPSSSAPPPR